MEINEIKVFIEKLQLLRSNLVCQQCLNESKSLCRIKVCGHYFCKNCLQSTQSCNKCKISVEERDFDWNNIIVQTTDTLDNLHARLHQALKSSEFTTNKSDLLVYKGNTYQLNFIEQQKVNVKGESTLHVACKRRKVLEVNNLLEKKVDINSQDYAGWVPLHEAIESGSQEIVEILLKHGALTDIPGEDYSTPLHKAVVCKNASIIKLLLQYGANKEPVDYFGRKPLDCIKDFKDFEHIFNLKVEIISVVPQLFLTKNMVAYCYYIETEYKNKLKQNNIKIEENYNIKKVTHFILRKIHKISIKILTAMIEGCTIVPQEYIDDYLKNDYIVPIPDYTYIYIPTLNAGIQKSMMNDLLKLPRLFDGINFYITGHSKSVTIHGIKVHQNNLAELINAGGGKVLHRAPTPSTCEHKINFPFHASGTNAKCCNYIIYEEHDPPLLMYHMSEIKHKSSNWLFDCVVNFTILD